MPGPAGPPRHYEVAMLQAPHTDEGLARFVRERDYLRAQLPYDFEWTAGMKAIEPTPPLDETGRPWSEDRWRTDSINGTMTVDEILAAARWAEEHRVRPPRLIGHSCMPFVTLRTAERMLEAAPDYLRGFLSAEDEQFERIPRYFAALLRPAGRPLPPPRRPALHHRQQERLVDDGAVDTGGLRGAVLGRARADAGGGHRGLELAHAGDQPAGALRPLHGRPDRRLPRLHHRRPVQLLPLPPVGVSRSTATPTCACWPRTRCWAATPTPSARGCWSGRAARRAST